MSLENIVIKNAKVHNLKNISLELPKNKLIVFTGLSGSGKSSLAFDTIYAEGQRRYVESLSAYARQFLGLMEKPDVEYIEGLSPAISIDQKSAGHNPRSTVGTVTEIYDYMRLLFARIGKPYDPKTNKPLVSQSVQEIVDRILDLGIEKEAKILLLAPIVRNRKGTYEELFQKFLSKGYSRVRADGMIHNLEDDIKLDRFKIHNIEIVIDRLLINKEQAKLNARFLAIKKENVKEELESDKTLNEFATFKKRLTDSVELSLNVGEEIMLVSILTDEKNTDLEFSENYVLSDGTSFPKLEPNLFSFNAPNGACPNCAGLGNISEIDPDLIYNPHLTIAEGAIYPWSKMWDSMNSWNRKVMETVCLNHKINIKAPMGELTKKELEIVFYGVPEVVRVETLKGNVYNAKFEGVITNLARRYKETESDYIRGEIEQYMRERVCPTCKGARLRKESLFVKIMDKNILEINSMTINEGVSWVKKLQEGDTLSESYKLISKQILKELNSRLGFLISVGLDYLTLSRTARTLSGGEAQRIRLASQIGSGLSGVLYVLDEPSIGLHQKDNSKLIKTLKYLRDLGNTVIVVEHDEDTIMNADWITDIGPKAGEHGGEVIFNGTLGDFLKTKTSITADYITGKRTINKEDILAKTELVEKDLNDLEVESFKTGDYMMSKKNKLMMQKMKLKLKDEEPKTSTQKYIEIIGAAENNLKNIDVHIPVGKFVCVTGSSGSGKSTLINDILAKKLMNHFYKSKELPGKHKEIKGLENIDKVVVIDQSPIGRTPRSNPATYTGVFNFIRDIFSQTKEAKMRGYGPGRFSFNTKGGRCEKCSGDGVIRIEMQFLPDVYVTCEECSGKRYNRDTLEIDFKGKNIADVLEMTIEESLKFFDNIAFIKNKLKTLDKVGLGYIRMGQSAVTLSGGEAQRVKLATELAKKQTGKTLYILDEPTTGLHFYDIEHLLVVLHSLVQKGNTVLVIEHNLDVIKTADYVIDLGPDGGDKGGEVIFEGTIPELLKNKKSYTAEWLKKTIHN
ncbi:MAG: excinuclease ABC subunit UvrA [bacterium]